MKSKAHCAQATVITLHFVRNEAFLELDRLDFTNPFTEGTEIFVCGRPPPLMKHARQITCNAGVLAFVILAVRQAAAAHGGANVTYVLAGNGGSAALELENALTNQSDWTNEIFGKGSRGELLASKFFHRPARGRKSPTEAAIALNNQLIPPGSITCLIADEPCGSPRAYEQLVLELEIAWQARNAVAVAAQAG